MKLSRWRTERYAEPAIQWNGICEISLLIVSGDLSYSARFNANKTAPTSEVRLRVGTRVIDSEYRLTVLPNGLIRILWKSFHLP